MSVFVPWKPTEVSLSARKTRQQFPRMWAEGGPPEEQGSFYYDPARPDELLFYPAYDHEKRYVWYDAKNEMYWGEEDIHPEGPHK